MSYACSLVQRLIVHDRITTIYNLQRKATNGPEQRLTIALSCEIPHGGPYSLSETEGELPNECVRSKVTYKGQRHYQRP